MLRSKHHTYLVFLPYFSDKILRSETDQISPNEWETHLPAHYHTHKWLEF